MNHLTEIKEIFKQQTSKQEKKIGKDNQGSGEWVNEPFAFTLVKNREKSKQKLTLSLLFHSTPLYLVGWAGKACLQEEGDVCNSTNLAMSQPGQS